MPAPVLAHIDRFGIASAIPSAADAKAGTGSRGIDRTGDAEAAVAAAAAQTLREESRGHRPLAS